MKLKNFFLLLIAISFYFSESFSQWTQAINIPGQRVAAIVKCGNKFFAGTSTGILDAGQIYSSSDNGATWNLVNTGLDISGVFSMTVRGNFIYVGTYEDALMMSSDAGNSWYINVVNGAWKLGVFGVGVSGESNILAYVNHGTGLELSTNNGASWAPVNPGSQISQLQTFVDLPGKLFAASRKGVALSTNQGANWTLPPNNGLASNPDGTRPVRALRIFNDKMFAGCIDKMYYSTDNGNNFTATNFQLGNWEYFTTMNSVGNKLFAGVSVLNNATSPSLLMTTNEGATWENYQGNGFPGKGVFALAVSDEYLIAGTSQIGIWIRPLEKFILNIATSLEAINLQDTITVELRSAVSPFSLIDTRKGPSGHQIPHLLEFTNVMNGVPYYIVVKHRNSISTWSSSAQSFSDNSLSFNFTSSEDQAYGSNMVNINGVWSFYSGDVNQDGAVNLTDVGAIKNDAVSFVTGYADTDLNYNGTVELADILTAYNNNIKFISEARP